jgi:hypothetical protein
MIRGAIYNWSSAAKAANTRIAMHWRLVWRGSALR